jgi:hypothetical protein
VKRLLARGALGLGVALTVLFALELGLRLVWGPPTAPMPHVRARWSMQGPAFLVRDGLVVPEFQGAERVRSFAARKAEGTQRVFFFGGSSVRGGSRLGAEEEAPGLLEARLLDRGLHAEVVNLGRGGLDSDPIRVILEQSLAFEPDLLVLYLGHNDLGNVIFQDRYGTVGASLGLRLRLLLGRSTLCALLTRALASSVDPVLVELLQARRQASR